MAACPGRTCSRGAGGHAGCLHRFWVFPGDRATVARGVAYTEPAASPAPYGAGDTAFGLDRSRACRRFAGPELDFNRPYLLLVTDMQTGEPVFLAKVTNPAQG